MGGTSGGGTRTVERERSSSDSGEGALIAALNAQAEAARAAEEARWRREQAALKAQRAEEQRLRDEEKAAREKTLAEEQAKVQAKKAADAAQAAGVQATGAGYNINQARSDTLASAKQAAGAVAPSVVSSGTPINQFYVPDYAKIRFGGA